MTETGARLKLSPAMEDYLKTIYQLRDEIREVTTAALAERLGVAAPSVTSMVKRLDGMGLVVHTPYQGIALSPVGEAAALEVIRHHRLIELYLATMLDMPWELVHAEAERLEHVLSEELEARMAAKLGQPVVDPHGHPIPALDGTVSARPTLTLWEVPDGSAARVALVSDRDPKLLAYLPTLGLVPGARVRVLEIAPYRATQTIAVGEEQHVIGSDLARNIWVWPEEA